jgi:demethylmenaquinone methyltransferase/2-methoxy-6-polyprenyl-1,4-benzoquinol methylase
MEWTFGWWQVSVQRVYPTTAELSQTYNRAANGWHQHLRVLGYSHAYRELWRSLKDANLLPPSKDNFTLCDCGMGTAAFSLAFAQAVNPGVVITGVDISSGMLKKAERVLSQTKIRHQTCQSDIQALPFVDESCDMVISAHMLEHLADPIQGLREIVRILRPGAPLVLVVTRSGLPGWFIQWHWGNRCFKRQQLFSLMEKAGLIRLQWLPFPIGLARLTSFACIGFRRD